jgi:hypothetical protein
MEAQQAQSQQLSLLVMSSNLTVRLTAPDFPLSSSLSAATAGPVLPLFRILPLPVLLMFPRFLQSLRPAYR